jgi:RNA exonuclease 4
MMPPQSKAASKKSHDSPMTKNDIYFAMDCEMVGVGKEGLDSAVARITIVNWENKVVLDTYVKVPVPVTDYRTYVSGIVAQDIESDKALSFTEARDTVTDIIRGKILIGHGLENDLGALGLTHPASDVRDTACYAPYMHKIVDSQSGALVVRPRKLRDLTREKLGREIQLPGSPHCPIDDAVAAMDLYKVARYDWEKELGRQQREKAQEQEKQERRWRYNFWSSQQQQAPPAPSTPHMYMSNDPMQMHYQHAMSHDPRLQQHAYGVVPGYGGHGVALPMRAPPPPPPPPPPPQAIPPPPPPPPQQPVQQQQSSSSPFWFRFTRPKTPPSVDELKPTEKREDSETTSTTLDESLENPISTSDEFSYLLPEMECVTLDSKSRSMTTVASQETIWKDDVMLVGGLPFYSEHGSRAWE